MLRDLDKDLDFKNTGKERNVVCEENVRFFFIFVCEVKKQKIIEEAK
jgi:hypothetical protein